MPATSSSVLPSVSSHIYTHTHTYRHRQPQSPLSGFFLLQRSTLFFSLPISFSLTHRVYHKESVFAHFSSSFILSAWSKASPHVFQALEESCNAIGAAKQAWRRSIGTARIHSDGQKPWKHMRWAEQHWGDDPKWQQGINNCILDFNGKYTPCPT